MVSQAVVSAATVDFLISKGGGETEDRILDHLSALFPGESLSDLWQKASGVEYYPNDLGDEDYPRPSMCLRMGGGRTLMDSLTEKTSMKVSWELDSSIEWGERKPEKLYVEIFSNGQRIMEEFVSTAMEAVRLQEMVDGAEA